MATDIMQPLRYVIDLQSGLVQQPMRGQLMKGDKKANRVIVELKDGCNKADLTGVTATGSFIRPPDAAEIPLAGSVDGNSAIIVLDDACYAQDGYCEIAVKLTVGDVSRTILSITGYVLSKGSGAYVDVSGVIPSLDDVIAQYAEMKRVTQETQEAADKANNAASHAPYIGANSNWFIWNAATGEYVDSGVTAKGTKGDKGDPGTIENVTITSIDGLTEALNALKEKNTAQDTAIGNKLGKSEQAADSSKLGGVAASQYAKKSDLEGVGGADPLTIYPVGSIYMSVNSTSPASLFGGTWEWLKDRFLLGAGGTYSAGSTGGEAEHVHGLDAGYAAMTISAGEMYYRYRSGGFTANWKFTGSSDAKADRWCSEVLELGGNTNSADTLPPYLAVYMWKRVS